MTPPLQAPLALTGRDTWVNWRRLHDTKVPVQPNGQPASSTHPATWTTLRGRSPPGNVRRSTSLAQDLSSLIKTLLWELTWTIACRWRFEALGRRDCPEIFRLLLGGQPGRRGPEGLGQRSDSGQHRQRHYQLSRPGGGRD